MDGQPPPPSYTELTGAPVPSVVPASAAATAPAPAEPVPAYTAPASAAMAAPPASVTTPTATAAPAPTGVAVATTAATAPPVGTGVAAPVAPETVHTVGSSVPEKIIFFIDTTSEFDGLEFVSKSLRSGAAQASYLTRLDCAKRVISNWVFTKHRMNVEHEFAIALLSEQVEWMTDFTTDPTTFHNNLDNIHTRGIFRGFDMGSIYDLVHSRIAVPAADTSPPPYVVRAILVYSRSNVIPQYLTGMDSIAPLVESPYFFLDVMYLHQKKSAENSPQDIFDHLLGITTPEAYVMEDSSNYRRMALHMATLLAHPLQRQPAIEAFVPWVVGGKK